LQNALSEGGILAAQPNAEKKKALFRGKRSGPEAGELKWTWLKKDKA